MKRLSENELLAVAMLVVDLAASHHLKKEKAPEAMRRDVVEWDIAQARQSIHQMCGIMLTDENDFTMKLGEALTKMAHRSLS